MATPVERIRDILAGPGGPVYATDYLALMSAITAALKAEREMREAWALLAPVMYNTYGCRNGAKAASETLNRLLGGE